MTGAMAIYNALAEETVSVLRLEEGYRVKYTLSPEGVPEGKFRRNS